MNYDDSTTEPIPSNSSAPGCHSTGDLVSVGFLIGLTVGVSCLVMIALYLNFYVIRRMKRKTLIW